MAQRSEGESSRSTARGYDRRTRAHVRTGRARKAARKAAAALDTPEGTAMREAETTGKSATRAEDTTLHKKGVPGQDPKTDPDLD